MSDGYHTKQWQQQPPPTGTSHLPPRPWFKTEDKSTHPAVLLQPHSHYQAHSFAPEQHVLPPPQQQQLHPHESPYPQQPPQPHFHVPPHYPQQPPLSHEEQHVAPPPPQPHPRGWPHHLQQPPQPHFHVPPHPYASKKKITRASLACDSCRAQKARCNEGRPCTTCQARKTECTYREPGPKLSFFSHTIEQVYGEIAKLQEMVQHHTQRLGAVEETVQYLARQYTAVNRAPRQTVPPSGPTVYYNTSAGLLLSWPTISEHVLRLLKDEGNCLPLEYPTRHEQERDNICWHVRCEGVIEPSPFTPVDITKDTPLRPIADLDLRPVTVWAYVESYKENIQNIYPLIPPNELHAMVGTFLQSEASTAQIGRVRSQAAAPERPLSQTTEKGFKRKRASETSGDGARAAPSAPRVGQSSHALVLMVLALGKICLHRRGCSPVAPGPSAWAGSGTAAAETRGSTDDNIGRDYFAAALSVFAALRAPPEVEDAWVCVLGSLYYDQLARPIPSLELVVEAGRLLQDIMQPDLERYSKIRADGHQRDSRDTETRLADNRKLVLAWTCMLVERDILVELHLPPSSMLSLSQHLPYPDGVSWLDQGFDQYVLEAFASQVYLYGLVNDICNSLYDGGRQDHSIVKAFIVALQKLRSPNDAFNRGPLFNHALPATDILAARLRAAYWRAEVLVYRGSIQGILASNHEKLVRGEMTEAPTDDMERLSELAAQAEAASSALQVELARRGIAALVQSTRAFHDVPGQRFVVTSVFGTAHAQWGNLLILDSVQRDPVLSRFIDKATVDDLFLKVIAFLERFAEPFSSLEQALYVLKLLVRARSRA